MAAESIEAVPVPSQPAGEDPAPAEAPPTSPGTQAPSAGTAELEGADGLDEADELDEVDELDELDELDALDDLDGLDALDELEATTGGGDAGFFVRSFKGYRADEVRVYTLSRKGSRNNEQLITEAELELDLNLVGGLHLFVRPWVFLDAFDVDLHRYEPLEGYLAYQGQRWDILAGQFIESWGIADAFNPLDVLNRRDVATDLIDAKVRGELGARFRYTFEGGAVIDQPTVALYVIPLYRETDFPTDNNRFAFSGGGLRLADEDYERPDFDDGAFAAIRVTHTLNTPILNADMQYVVARGPDRFPAFGIRPSAAGIDLVPQPYGAWVWGGGFRAVPNVDGLNKFTLKSEVVYKRLYRLDGLPDTLPEDFVQMVFGLDRQFVGWLSGKDQLTLTIEYATEAGANDAQSRFRPFNNDLILRLFWEAGDFARTSVEARAIYDVDNGETIAEGIIKRQLRFLHDDLSLQLSAQYIDGSSRAQTLFSRFPNNHSLRARLQLDF